MVLTLAEGGLATAAAPTVARFSLQPLANSSFIKASLESTRPYLDRGFVNFDSMLGGSQMVDVEIQ